MSLSARCPSPSGSSSVSQWSRLLGERRSTRSASLKAKTSAPAPDLPTSCAARNRRGLVAATHTGSRERGGGLRQTLEQARARGHVRQRGDAGTAWATPLAHRLPALARDFAALSAPNGA